MISNFKTNRIRVFRNRPISKYRVESEYSSIRIRFVCRQRTSHSNSFNVHYPTFPGTYVNFCFLNIFYLLFFSRKRESDMLREQYLGLNRFRRMYDTRRTQSCGLRGRGYGGHDNLFVHCRPLFVANNDVVGHFRFLPI